MYTRCPECQTPYRVTRAQLTARDGLVRCGQCQAVFTATDHLLWFAPTAEEPQGHPDSTPPAPAHRTRRRRKNAGAPTYPPYDPAIPTMSDSSLRRHRRRLPTWLWFTVNSLLAIGLTAQVFYFYRHELARNDTLRPLLAHACRVVGCVLAPASAWIAPELSASTMAPHPRFVNALRLRAVLVNRAARPQEPPLLEVTLTDSGGNILARRRFSAADYLQPSATARLQPNIATRILLDVTNPDGKAVGYELVLLPPDDVAPNL